MPKRFAFCLLLGWQAAFAQTESLDSIAQALDLKTITVTSTRMEEPALKSPWAITALDATTLADNTQQLQLNDFLEGVPGVFAINAYNFAQDLRLSIRGFGARSAFGIRGVKLLVDGLPESTPDGQGQVDNIDLGLVEQLEVLRGSAASLYGNAAGGVVNITTDELPTVGFVEAAAIGGSYGFRRYQLKGGQSFKKVDYLLSASYTNMAGYRAHNTFENTVLSGKVGWFIDPTASLKLIVNYVNSPQAQDPGALLASEQLANRRQARSRNVQFDAGEQVEQLKLGLIFTKRFDYGNSLEAKVYRIGRDFENRLPFSVGGAVDLQRSFWGGQLSWRFAKQLGNISYQSIIGAEAESQTDDRTRFFNNNGIRGERTFEQEELFQSLSGFVIQQFSYEKLRLRLGGRLDYLQLEATDRFLADGDNSDTEAYTRFNPSIGLSYELSNRHFVYANWSTSFETPTLSERFGNPVGLGDVAPLEPQTASNYEIGIKGWINPRLRYELAAFYLQLRNELIPFELQAFPNRSFFRNAGRSNRAGIELGLLALWGKGWSSRFSYTYSAFTFDDYEVGNLQLNGNRLPGIPDHQATASVRYQASSGLYGRLSGQLVGSFFADDINSEEIPSYVVLNLRAGYRFSLVFLHAEPFIGINNLSDNVYPANVRLNAFGGRYFEPAPVLHFYAGVRVRFGEK